MKFMEIETKYNASEISLAKFNEFCQAQPGERKYLVASGWDYFYDSTRTEGFARHRVGVDFNQLTYKRKTTAKNNFIRQEDNLNLMPPVTVSQVASFLNKFGYTLNKSIFKNCFIYQYDRHTAVYYVIYDDTLKEVGRYIEIEMSEDYSWKSEQEAWDALTNLEREFKELGLSAQGRMKKSLYEIVCE